MIEIPSLHRSVLVFTIHVPYHYLRFSAQVLVQGLLLQLWAPLSSVGGLYRRLRKALVDLEDLVAVLRMRPSLVDGDREF